MQSRHRILVSTPALTLILVAVLSACGQKGDLYLPDPEPEPKNSEQTGNE
jgi:predicted small lipoprotein YifL